MNVKTFKAKTIADALRLVHDELGPDARVLSTKDETPGWWGRLTGRSEAEVTALRQHEDQQEDQRPVEARHVSAVSSRPSIENQVHPYPASKGRFDYRNQLKQFAQEEASESFLESMIEQYESSQRETANRIPSSLFQLFSDLIEADVDDEFAREVVDEVQQNCTPAELVDATQVQRKVATSLCSRITVAPGIRDYVGQRRVVALIGPTGVGKTTTIAKLAANLRLRDNRRVGLITVDTYRMAAVDQLRAYADIIDLPMEVVTTPREMREAVLRLSDAEIVLIDTAGRSPRDGIQLQELKAMLNEARPDEVQLVLSSVSSGKHLSRLAEQFTPVSPTSLLITKLDEATTYGHLLPLLCRGRLPLSYTTHGQNVPDDIQTANPSRLIESVFDYCKD